MKVSHLRIATVLCCIIKHIKGVSWLDQIRDQCLIFLPDTWAHRISYSGLFVEKYQFQGTVPTLRVRTTGERRPSANQRFGNFRFLIELAVIRQGMHHFVAFWPTNRGFHVRYRKKIMKEKQLCFQYGGVLFFHFENQSAHWNKLADSYENL